MSCDLAFHFWHNKLDAPKLATNKSFKKAAEDVSMFEPFWLKSGRLNSHYSFRKNNFNKKYFILAN